MSSSSDADEYVKLTIDRLTSELAERQRHELAQARGEFAASGVLQSSGRVQAEQRIRLALLRELVDRWVEIEVKARRRFGCPLDEDWEHRLTAAIGDMLARAEHHEADESRSSRFEDFTARGCEEIRALRARAGTAVELARLEERMRSQAVDSSVNITIGTNLGTIVGRIDALDVGSNVDELRGILREVIEAAKALPGPASQEAQDLVRGLVNEAEKGADQSPSTVHLIVGRLRELLALASDVVTVSAVLNLDKIPALIALLAGR